MISKETLGRRLRDVRQRHKLTLKDVEDLSGLSSTHISEIERGMTSPTVGALIRIAHAMRKDPSYFIEERELEEVCVTTQEDRPVDEGTCAMEVTRGRADRLTRGILGGRICAHELRLDPGGRIELKWLSAGQDVCLYCLQGNVVLKTERQEMSLGPGDSVHGALTGAPSLSAQAGTGGRVVMIVDPRAESR